MIGWIDYHDKFYSRKVALIDNVYANWILGFFAWICNRKQVLFQVPIIAFWTYVQPEKVLEHLELSAGAKSSNGEITE